MEADETEKGSCFPSMGSAPGRAALLLIFPIGWRRVPDTGNHERQDCSGNQEGVVRAGGEWEITGRGNRSKGKGMRNRLKRRRQGGGSDLR